MVDSIHSTGQSPPASRPGRRIPTSGYSICRNPCIWHAVSRCKGAKLTWTRQCQTRCKFPDWSEQYLCKCEPTSEISLPSDSAIATRSSTETNTILFYGFSHELQMATVSERVKAGRRQIELLCLTRRVPSASPLSLAPVLHPHEDAYSLTEPFSPCVVLVRIWRIHLCPSEPRACVSMPVKHSRISSTMEVWP